MPSHRNLTPALIIANLCQTDLSATHTASRNVLANHFTQHKDFFIKKYQSDPIQKEIVTQFKKFLMQNPHVASENVLSRIIKVCITYASILPADFCDQLLCLTIKLKNSVDERLKALDHDSLCIAIAPYLSQKMIEVTLTCAINQKEPLYIRLIIYAHSSKNLSIDIKLKIIEFLNRILSNYRYYLTRRFILDIIPSTNDPALLESLTTAIIDHLKKHFNEDCSRTHYALKAINKSLQYNLLSKENLNTVFNLFLKHIFNKNHNEIVYFIIYNIKNHTVTSEQLNSLTDIITAHLLSMPLQNLKNSFKDLYDLTQYCGLNEEQQTQLIAKADELRILFPVPSLLLFQLVIANTNSETLLLKIIKQIEKIILSSPITEEEYVIIMNIFDEILNHTILTKEIWETLYKMTSLSSRQIPTIPFLMAYSKPAYHRLNTPTFTISQNIHEQFLNKNPKPEALRIYILSLLKNIKSPLIKPITVENLLNNLAHNRTLNPNFINFVIFKIITECPEKISTSLYKKIIDMIRSYITITDKYDYLFYCNLALTIHYTLANNTSSPNIDSELLSTIADIYCRTILNIQNKATTYYPDFDEKFDETNAHYPNIELNSPFNMLNDVWMSFSGFHLLLPPDTANKIITNYISNIITSDIKRDVFFIDINLYNHIVEYMPYLSPSQLYYCLQYLDEIYPVPADLSNLDSVSIHLEIIKLDLTRQLPIPQPIPISATLFFSEKPAQNPLTTLVNPSP